MFNRIERWGKALVPVAILLLATGLIMAQATTSRVNGVVTDENGDPVSGAKLTFISPVLQGERVVETDDNGRYVAALLPSGSYAVSVAAPGKQPVEYSFRLGVGQSFPLDISLSVGSDMVEEVVVYGNLSKLQTTANGETFEYTEQVETLPLTARNLENVAQLAPNISFGPTVSQERDNFDLAIAGAPAMDTIVLLDGAEISDPLFGSGTNIYFEDSLKDLQVMTSGVSAKYGRFTGGVLNAVTKGGSNEFSATARMELDQEDWNSQTPFGESQSDDLNKRYWATASGRIVRDHLWFFVGGRTIPETSNNKTTTVTNESFTTVTEQDRYQFRLTGAINADHTIDASYLEYEQTTAGRDALPAAEALAVGNRMDPRDMTTVSYQGVLTSNLFLDVKATEKNAGINSGGDPNGGSPFIDWTTFNIYNNHWWDFADTTARDNETISANLTQVFSGLGSHTLEYGVQKVDSTTGGENRQSVTGFNFISRDAMFCYDAGNMQPCADTLGIDMMPVAAADIRFNINSAEDNRRLRALNLGGDQTIENLAFYVQDSWQFNDNWRFDIGVRYDDYSGDGPLNELNLDYDAVSPRLAVTRNIGEDWQAQIAWGEYTGRLNDNWVQAVTNVGDAPGIDYFYTGPDFLMVDRAVVEQVLQDTHPSCALEPNGTCWNQVLGVGDPDQPTTFLADDLESPTASDLNFSLKRALPRNTGTVAITYTQRQFRGLVDDFIGAFDTGMGVITINDPFDPGPMPATFPVDPTVWANNPDARRTYQGFTVTLDYRPSSRWNIGGNYTLSETVGNYEGEGQNTPGAGSPLGDYSDTRPDELAAPVGYLDEDQRHRANVWGNYRFDFGRAGNLVLGGVLQANSGRAYSLSTTVPKPGSNPTNVNDSGTYTRFFGGRGEQRFNGIWALDVSARYQVQIWNKLDSWIKLSIRNLTNEDTLETFNTSGFDQAVNGVPNPGAPMGTDCSMNPELCSFELVFVGGGNFGNPDNDRDYMRPREYLVTLGFDW